MSGMTKERLAEIEHLLEVEACGPVRDAGRVLIAEVRRLQSHIDDALAAHPFPGDEQAWQAEREE